MAALSIVAGPPLAEEEGLGTLTLGGWLREVTQAHAGREALVFHGPDGVVRWSHDDLWAQANAVARSLVACGVGKGTRVGVLMTNRPEFLSAVFGVALAGGFLLAQQCDLVVAAEQLVVIGATGVLCVLLFRSGIVGWLERLVKRNFK